MRSRITLWDCDIPIEEKRSRLMKLQRWLCRWDEGASCNVIDIQADNLFNTKGLEAEWMCMIDTLRMAYPEDIHIHTTLPDDRTWLKNFFKDVKRRIYLHTDSHVTDGELGDNVLFCAPSTTLELEHDWRFTDKDPTDQMERD